MKNILIINGHTDFKASIANKKIIEVLEKQLSTVRIVNLIELYPDFKIDIEAEQVNLSWAEIIILQFPFFWYSAPSILERWMEETFQHGFSHGRTGDKLKGKKLILSFTTGAPENMYNHDAAVGYTIDDFLSCYKATCRMTQMIYCGDIYTCGVSYSTRATPEHIEQQELLSVKHAERLIQLLNTI